MIRRSETLTPDWENWWNKWDKGIPGWFNILEGKFLFDVVYNLPWPASIIEIGAYRGRSTIAMMKAIQLSATEQARGTSDRKMVASVDNFSGTGEQHGAPNTDQVKEGVDTFYLNLRVSGLGAYFSGLHVMTSHDWFATSPEGLLYSMFFIDGCHLTAGEDVLAAWKRLKPGGMLVCHDYDPNAPSKVSADIDATGVPGKHCGVHGTSLWVAEKP